ncbi:hypothetical protein B0H67DRAFT_376834 [Lasiosphaeris hirsuta]|uniref:Uncharacterized protein n=1 Tax=Lasiosphaeris hirsuta TaxID=260670 RepID=A0AA39ZX62_9PEZI|nr:hypothetical protein B0H67DRAFT_376834 [Lasiosphaeris hirsuta]
MASHTVSCSIKYVFQSRSDSTVQRMTLHLSESLHDTRRLQLAAHPSLPSSLSFLTPVHVERGVIRAAVQCDLESPLRDRPNKTHQNRQADRHTGRQTGELAQTGRYRDRPLEIWLLPTLRRQPDWRLTLPSSPLRMHNPIHTHGRTTATAGHIALSYCDKAPRPREREAFFASRCRLPKFGGPEIIWGDVFVFPRLFHAYRRPWGIAFSSQEG